MARRNTRTTLENEIERARVEGRWETVKKLIEQISNRTTSESKPDLQKILLLGEVGLETWIRDNPLGTLATDEARGPLQSAVKILQKAAIVEGKKDDKNQEAVLLLCKAHFFLQDYQACVSHLDQVASEEFTVDVQSRRRSKLFAEGFAYKGMALEELQSRGDSSVNTDDIITCYECAGDVAMWLMAGQKTTSSLVIPPLAGEMGTALEVAIQRAPILHIKAGNLPSCIKRFRNVLKALESKATHELRKIVARQLSEVLLRGVCDETYEKPVYVNTNIPGSTASLSRGASKLDTPKTTSYKTSSSLTPLVHSGDSLFVPRDEMEEVLLLLLLEDTMVLRDAVLSQSPEKKEERQRTSFEANAVYDLLVIALTRRAQYGMLVECLDKGMKLAFEEFHLWFQFGLSLISAGKFHRALLVLRQCAEMNPKDPLVPLHAAKLCFNYLHSFDEGVGFAKRVVDMGDDTMLASKGYEVLGIGYSLQAGEASLSADRQRLQKLSIDALENALDHDPNDPDILFHLALTQAYARQISRALKNLRKAVKLDGDNVNYLHLLALLLSAQNKYGEALEVCEAALLEFPEEFSLLLTKVKLEVICIGGDQALITCKHLLETWKQAYESEIIDISTEIKRTGSGLLDKVVADTRSLKQFPLTEISSDKEDTGSIAASIRLEQALSDEASTSIAKLSIPGILALQAKLWLAVADVFIGIDKDAEANACIQEANLIFPLSADVLFQRGRIYEIRGSLNEAKTMYNNAISINQHHIPSLQRLGLVHEKLNNLVMAEKVLREAINVDPTAHVAWHYLGVVLERQGQHEAASECLFTAVDLEATAPIISFSVIPRML